MSASATDADVDAMVDDLMALLEAQGLVGAGEGDRTLEFVVHRDGSQAIDADRALVQSWSTRWSSKASFEIGPLTDLNPAA